MAGFGMYWGWLRLATEYGWVKVGLGWVSTKERESGPCKVGEAIKQGDTGVG